MKKLFSLFWQILLFPLLCVPYTALNQAVIVKWLGCGCPRLDAAGNEIVRVFNANDFTRLFWLGIAVIVIVLSLFSMRKIAKWLGKLAYIGGMTAVSLYLASYFTTMMMWR